MTDPIIQPTTERLRHARTPAVTAPDGTVLVAANDNVDLDQSTRAVRMSDSPLDRLLRTGRISIDQHSAGMQFYADWYNAGLAPLGAIDYSKIMVDGSKASAISEFKLGAKDRYNRSCEMLGTYFRPTVEAICLHEQAIESAGRKLGFRNASQARAVALDRLCGGLDLLVRRYRRG